MLFSLLGGMLLTNTGCGLLQAVFCYHPRGMRGVCDSPAMVCEGEECGGAVCGPSCRPRCGTVCSSCGCNDCSGFCNPYCCRPWHRGPLSCVFALLMPGCWCGSSCGERYWGDFYTDPPDCWDPCDCHGNYTGVYENPNAGYGYPTGTCPHCGAARGTTTYSARNVTNGTVINSGISTTEAPVVSRNERTVSPAPTPVAQPHRAAKR